MLCNYDNMYCIVILFKTTSNQRILFQNGGAKDGLDMNLGPAWQKGYTGKGVVVSILDDGIQTNHPDLAQNYVSIIYLTQNLFL